MSVVKQWAWHVEEEESATGPFKSRDAALVDARATVDPGTKIVVGTIAHVVPEKHAGLDLDWFVETMEEDASGEFCAEQEMLETLPGAAEALDAVLKKWARKYVKSTWWQMDGETYEQVVA